MPLSGEGCQGTLLSLCHCRHILTPLISFVLPTCHDLASTADARKEERSKAEMNLQLEINPGSLRALTWEREQAPQGLGLMGKRYPFPQATNPSCAPLLCTCLSGDWLQTQELSRAEGTEALPPGLQALGEG